MKYTFSVQNRRVTAILLISAVVFVAIWWLYPHVAESAHTRAEPVEIRSLTAPAGFTAADEDPDTAFREGDAGFSAWVRVEASEQGSDAPALDIGRIVSELTSAPEESAIRLAGAIDGDDGLGLNFAIITLPMYAAVISSPPTETVTVYFDDQGWIVAYLPKERPAAAIWKYTSMGDTTDETGLENNLLVLAINEVLKADDANAEKVGHDNVNYYDWQYQDCNAFALFSAVAEEGGKSDTVKFVVPRTITEIGASAAVVMTEPIDQGGYNFASIIIDENRVPANTDYPRNAAGFKLARDTNETSLHEMTVYVSEDNKAAGVVMLVYAKPPAN